jgi:hypothetical protein
MNGCCTGDRAHVARGVPEVSNILDVTDRGGGENPFYS